MSRTTHQTQQYYYHGGHVGGLSKQGVFYSIFRREHLPLAIASSDSGSDLLRVDDKHSVLSSTLKNHPRAYSAYGHQSGIDSEIDLLGFNGELRLDARHYALGNGYRTYDPILMRFHAPDNVSPFEEGGINAYAYCSGEPVNLSDPSGHGPDSLIPMQKIIKLRSRTVGQLQSHPAQGGEIKLITNASKASLSKQAFAHEARIVDDSLYGVTGVDAANAVIDLNQSYVKASATGKTPLRFFISYPGSSTVNPLLPSSQRASTSGSPVGASISRSPWISSVSTQGVSAPQRPRQSTQPNFATRPHSQRRSGPLPKRVSFVLGYLTLIGIGTGFAFGIKAMVESARRS